jgi:peptidoglycan/LPS O-acetylase OafA/YrhL
MKQAARMRLSQSIDRTWMDCARLRSCSSTPSLMGPGGFVGVDVFFVISGFLISGILFDEIDANTFTFRDCYSRRIRRLFPALAVVCVAYLGFGCLCLLPGEFRQLGTH